MKKECKFSVGDKVVITGQKGSGHTYPKGTELIIKSIVGGKSKRCIDLGLKSISFTNGTQVAYEDEIDFITITKASLEKELVNAQEDRDGILKKIEDIKRKHKVLEKYKKNEMGQDKLRLYFVADELEEELSIDTERAIRIAQTLLSKV
jgi:hypothetical protein